MAAHPGAETTSQVTSPEGCWPTRNPGRRVLPVPFWDVAQPADLEPVISQQDLPIEVRAVRDLAAAEFAKSELDLQVLIDLHIDAYEKAVERLVSTHASIASGTDLIIGSDTRWSAIWELSGRCLTECRLLIHALRAGFSVEASSNVRAMFEAMYLLAAVEFDDATARRWLAGDDVRPKKARAVMATRQALARERMKEQGVQVMGDVVATGEWLYKHFSDSAHHRRGAITASISLERREFAYGPHPDPAKRGCAVDHAGELIETALIVVIGSLAHIVGPDGLSDALAEQAAVLEQLRTTQPLG
jgi:hypothetical protein